jgi:hypothetical protein
MRRDPAQINAQTIAQKLDSFIQRILMDYCGERVVGTRGFHAFTVHCNIMSRLGSKAELLDIARRVLRAIFSVYCDSAYPSWARAMLNLTLKKSVANRSFARFHGKTLGKFCSRTSAFLLARYHTTR